MTVTDTDLDLRIKTFKASSAFSPGDICSFSINFSDKVKLPGKYDPAAYLRRLDVDVKGKDVLIVCPGNAGLAVAALRAGASTVVVLEPRNVYQRSLPEISAFTSETLGTTFTRRGNDDKLVETFDIVIWSEGLDEIPHPKSLVERVLGTMKQGAPLYIEVNHGHCGVLPESINSWKPTTESFSQTISELGDLEIGNKVGGRSQTRSIYAIQNNTVRPVKEPEAVEKVKADEKPKKPRAQRKKKKKKKATKVNTAETIADKVRDIITPKSAHNELDLLYGRRPSTPKSKETKELGN